MISCMLPVSAIWRMEVAMLYVPVPVTWHVDGAMLCVLAIGQRATASHPLSVPVPGQTAILGNSNKQLRANCARH